MSSKAVPPSGDGDDAPEVEEGETTADVLKDFRTLRDDARIAIRAGDHKPAAALFNRMRKNRIPLNVGAEDLEVYVLMAGFATMMPGKGTVSGQAPDAVFGKAKDRMSKEEQAADEVMACQWFLDGDRCRTVFREKFPEVGIAVQDIGTHSAKFPTASADGTTAIFGASDVVVDKATPFVSSMTIARPQRLLSSGNAAQMHYARFLCHEVTVGGTTSTVAVDLATRAGIHAIVMRQFNDTAFIETLCAALSLRMQGGDVTRVSGENKTIFWPIGDGEYHMITPLASSTMLLDFNRRVWDIRKSPNRIYTSTLKHGGSSPQNLGSLGGDLTGNLIHLRASVPPLNAKGIEATYHRLRRGGSYLKYPGKDDIAPFIKALAARRSDDGDEIALNVYQRATFDRVSNALVHLMLSDLVTVATALSSGQVFWDLDGREFSKISTRVKCLLDPERRPSGLISQDRDALIADLVATLRDSRHEILLTGPMLDRFEKAAAKAIEEAI